MAARPASPRAEPPTRRAARSLAIVVAAGAIPCGLLLNELITNSLKHAFKDGRSGELRVELARNDDRIRLAVKDNGVGLPAGLDVRGGKSLGLRLVNTLVRQLRGTLDIADRGGACFELHFAVETRR
jgi:two-component sensor histidine kinase